MLLVRDTGARFGLVSVLLHWYVAMAVLLLLPAGLVILYLGPHGALRPLRADLTWWHLSIGVTSIPFFLCRIFWRLRHGKPKTSSQHWALSLTADTVWRLLLILLVWQMFTGPGLELSHGNTIHWFGITLIPEQPWFTYTSFFHDAHVYGACTIAGLLVLHIGGTLKHVLVDHDGVLRGMVWPIDTKQQASPARA